jgi:hypothetical protein
VPNVESDSKQLSLHILSETYFGEIVKEFGYKKAPYCSKGLEHAKHVRQLKYSN